MKLGKGNGLFSVKIDHLWLKMTENDKNDHFEAKTKREVNVNPILTD